MSNVTSDKRLTRLQVRKLKSEAMSMFLSSYGFHGDVSEFKTEGHQIPWDAWMSCYEKSRASEQTDAEGVNRTIRDYVTTHVRPEEYMSLLSGSKRPGAILRKSTAPSEVLVPEVERQEDDNQSVNADLGSQSDLNLDSEDCFDLVHPSQNADGTKNWQDMEVTWISRIQAMYLRIRKDRQERPIFFGAVPDGLGDGKDDKYWEVAGRLRGTGS